MWASALCLLLLLQALGPQSDAVARLRVRVPVTPLTLPAEALAGKYTSASEELGRRWGGGHLSGEDLHLFPDGTYIYCEWADIESMTVYDKGSWRIRGSTLELVSDPDIAWDPGAERKYVTVARAGHKNDAILAGLERALPGFETDANDDPGLSLLLVGLLRTERYTANKAAQTKRRLMREAWNPDYFRRARGSMP